jgi:hypothetical protein
MGEGRSADLAPARPVGAIGDEIDAELALRSFHGDVDLAGGHAKALAVELDRVFGTHRSEDSSRRAKKRK